MRQSGGVGHDLLFELGLPQPEHAAQLLGGEVRVEDLLHLLKAETQFLQRDDPVEPGQLADRVGPVPGRPVDLGGPEQSGGVVLAQHPDRHPSVPGKISNAEHDTPV